MRKSKILAFLITFVCSFSLLTAVSAQIEICDNAIDDDNDGAIDFNDSDCYCIQNYPTSLIPNPSFEDMICCPQGAAELYCAVDWIQASVATSDYIHTCDFQGIYTAPQPYPDGDACVGFRDGKPNISNAKEYVGACLTEPIQGGINYTMNFFLGFQSASHSPDITIALYGSTDCSNLPFGTNNTTFGCPLNDTGWFLLGEVFAPSNPYDWTNHEIQFNADEDVHTIILGSTCADNVGNNYQYYYFDQLTLAASTDFGLEIDEIEGSPCTDDFVIGVASLTELSYQWYNDGVAIVGATSPTYMPFGTLGNGLGTYTLLIDDGTDCEMTLPFVVEVPMLDNYLDVALCEGESIMVGNESYAESGGFQIQLQNEEGCDSIVFLTLEVAPNFEIFDEVTICIGEEIEFDGSTLDAAGNYTADLLSSAGCDSIVHLNLMIETAITSVFVEPEFQVDLGESVNIDPQTNPALLQSYGWYDENGILVSTNFELDILPFDNMVYTFEAIDLNNCPHVVSSTVLVNKFYDYYVPNIFSPNADGFNDYFTAFGNQSIAQINEVQIFDRWGQVVFAAKNIPANEPLLGWDGNVRNKAAQSGVYTFWMKIGFIDGEEFLHAGSLTIVR